MGLVANSLAIGVLAVEVGVPRPGISPDGRRGGCCVRYRVRRRDVRVRHEDDREVDTCKDLAGDCPQSGAPSSVPQTRPSTSDRPECTRRSPRPSTAASSARVVCVRRPTRQHDRGIAPSSATLRAGPSIGAMLTKCVPVWASETTKRSPPRTTVRCGSAASALAAQRDGRCQGACGWLLEAEGEASDGDVQPINVDDSPRSVRT